MRTYTNKRYSSTEWKRKMPQKIEILFSVHVHTAQLEAHSIQSFPLSLSLSPCVEYKQKENNNTDIDTMNAIIHKHIQRNKTDYLNLHKNTSGIQPLSNCMRIRNTTQCLCCK